MSRPREGPAGRTAGSHTIGGRGCVRSSADLCAQMRTLHAQLGDAQSQLAEKQASLELAQAQRAQLAAELQAKGGELQATQQALAAAREQVRPQRELSAGAAGAGRARGAKPCDTPLVPWPQAQQSQAAVAELAVARKEAERLRQMRDEARGALKRSADELVAAQLRNRQLVRGGGDRSCCLARGGARTASQ